MIRLVRNINRFRDSLLVICAILLLFPLSGRSTEFTSSSFKIIDPVISVGGGRSTSSSFQIERSVGQPAVGISNSPSFQLKAGFLYFGAPAPAPAPAPTPAALAAAVPPAGGGGPLFPSRIVFPILPLRIELPPLPFPFQACGADFNCDGRIDLADASSFLFLSGYSPAANPADLNRDGRVSLADISILFYHWTERVSFVAPHVAEMAHAVEEVPAGTASLAEGVRRFQLVGNQREETRALLREGEPERPGLLRRMWNALQNSVRQVFRLLPAMLQ